MSDNEGIEVGSAEKYTLDVNNSPEDVLKQERLINVEERVIRIRGEVEEKKHQRKQQTVVLYAAIFFAFALVVILFWMIAFSHNEFHQHVATHLLALFAGACLGNIFNRGHTMQ